MYHIVLESDTHILVYLDMLDVDPVFLRFKSNSKVNYAKYFGMHNFLGLK